MPKWVCMCICAITLVITIIYVCVSVCAGPLMVIVEYCRYGNLSAFLKGKREVFVHNTVSLQTTWKMKPYFTRNTTSVACKHSSQTPVCPTLQLLLAVEKKQKSPLCAARNYKIIHSKTHFCNLFEVWRCYLFSSRTFSFLNFFTSLDMTKNCSLKGHFHRAKHVYECLNKSQETTLSFPQQSESILTFNCPNLHSVTQYLITVNWFLPISAGRRKGWRARLCRPCVWQPGQY